MSPTQNVRVLVLAGYRAVRAAPLVDPRPRRDRGRSTASPTTVPGRAAPQAPGARRRRSTASRRPPGASASTPPTGRRSLYSAVVSGRVVVRPDRRSATRLQLDSRPSSYDTYRGLAQGRARRELGERRQPRRRWTSTCGASSRSRCRPTGRSRPSARRPSPPARYAVRRLHPGDGRVRRLRRHAIAGLPRASRPSRRRRARSSTPRPGEVLQSGNGRSSTRSSTRPAAARPRTTSTCSCRRAAP